MRKRILIQFPVTRLAPGVDYGSPAGISAISIKESIKNLHSFGWPSDLDHGKKLLKRTHGGDFQEDSGPTLRKRIFIPFPKKNCYSGSGVTRPPPHVFRSMLHVAMLLCDVDVDIWLDGESQQA